MSYFVITTGQYVDDGCGGTIECLARPLMVRQDREEAVLAARVRAATLCAQGEAYAGYVAVEVPGAVDAFTAEDRACVVKFRFCVPHSNAPDDLSGSFLAVYEVWA